MGYHAAVGAWRSLVAHLHGVQGVASSNLAAPTNQPGFLAVMNQVLEGAQTPFERA